MPIIARPKRNTLFLRVEDDLLQWIDTARGPEDRSTFIRKSLEKEATRELPKDGQDGDLSAHTG